MHQHFYDPSPRHSALSMLPLAFWLPLQSSASMSNRQLIVPGGGREMAGRPFFLSVTWIECSRVGENGLFVRIRRPDRGVNLFQKRSGIPRKRTIRKPRLACEVFLHIPPVETQRMFLRIPPQGYLLFGPPFSRYSTQ